MATSKSVRKCTKCPAFEQYAICMQGLHCVHFHDYEKFSKGDKDKFLELYSRNAIVGNQHLIMKKLEKINLQLIKTDKRITNVEEALRRNNFPLSETTVKPIFEIRAPVDPMSVQESSMGIYQSATDDIT